MRFPPSQVLTDYKAALAEILDTGAALQRGIAAKQDQLDKFAGDKLNVCREHDKAARLLRRITAAEHDRSDHLPVPGETSVQRPPYRRFKGSTPCSVSGITVW